MSQPVRAPEKAGVSLAETLSAHTGLGTRMMAAEFRRDLLDAPLQEALDPHWPGPARGGGLWPVAESGRWRRSDAKPPRLCVDGESRSGVSRDRCRRTNAN